jgi:hypothetical protein
MDASPTAMDASPKVMDAECAFCGRIVAAARQVFCADCQAQHAVCRACAEEAAADPESYRLVA